MKTLIVAFLAVFTINTQAAHIMKAEFDADNSQIVLDVAYSGGCYEHEFELEYDVHCLETYPAKQVAQLVDLTQGKDTCKAIIAETLRFDVDEDTPVCAPAYLTIQGKFGTRATVLVK